MELHEERRPIFHLKPVREKQSGPWGPYVSGMDVQRRERHAAQARVSGARVEDIPPGEMWHDTWPIECRRCNLPQDAPEEQPDPDYIEF